MHCFSAYYELTGYMFQALFYSSSGGTADTTIGIFCAYYVGWRLPGLEFHTNPGAAYRRNTHAVYQVLFVKRLLKMSK
jgi:hypothetical protein